MSRHVLPLLTSIYSILKITKIRNKIEGDTEDSTAQGSKDREIELISRKVPKKRKDIQQKKLSATQREITVKELGASENIARKVIARMGIGS